MLKIFVLLRCFNFGTCSDINSFCKSNAGIENKGKFKSIPEKIILNYRLKSEIKMDKQKLIRIIFRDLDELKLLTEEVEETKSNPALILGIAMSKANLLNQEYELLRELINQEFAVQKVNDQEEEEEEDIDVETDFATSETELEILDFEENEIPEETKTEQEQKEDSPEENETDEEEQIDLIEPEFEVATDEDIIEDIEKDDYNPEIEEEDEDEREEQEIEEELEDEIEFPDENEEDELDIDEDIEDERKDANVIELNENDQSEIREIHIDESEDSDFESFPSSQKKSSEKPVMHEIPKPEEPAPEKMVVGETFNKGRSLNDAIGETNATESKLNNGPIASLRAAIGLNDRFLFIREIFENNTDRYNTVIDNLDKLETIQQAVDYLKANLTLQKNETSMKFVDLLKRRFSK